MNLRVKLLLTLNCPKLGDNPVGPVQDTGGLPVLPSQSSQATDALDEGTLYRY